MASAHFLHPDEAKASEVVETLWTRKGRQRLPFDGKEFSEYNMLYRNGRKEV